jgi:rubrerythrin
VTGPSRQNSVILKCKPLAAEHALNTQFRQNKLSSSINVPLSVLGHMEVRTVFTRLLPGNRPDVIIECRHCGTTIDPPSEACPECGTTEFCRYEIPQ